MKRKSRQIWFLCLLAFAFMVAASLHAEEHPYALSGTLVTPIGIVPHGTILIASGTIQAIGADIVVPSGTPVVETDGVIFPGLIDTHNHLIWNVFPRWKPAEPVGDRYDWQAMRDYVAKLAGPEKVMVERGNVCDMERFAEVKAMLGGATSVVGSYSPKNADPHANECVRGLARNLDVFSGLYSPTLNSEPLAYEVFPFEMPYLKAEAIREAMASGKIKALLIHVAEGKDASSAREFTMLKADGFVRPGVSIIHGVSLEDAAFHEMARNGVSLIWSPHSNISLYGVTANVASAKAAGVTIAIAPDWSPSGTNGMTEELQYAYRWNARQRPPVFTPSDFVDMATRNPALLAGAGDKIGALAVGYAADLVVLPRRDGPAPVALVEAQPGSIRLVVVGGKPMLGDRDLMSALLPSERLELLKVCSNAKSLNIRDDLGGQSFNELAEHLRKELRRLNLSLADLADCGNRTQLSVQSAPEHVGSQVGVANVKGQR